MPDYTTRIRLLAPELSGGEFRRLRTQLEGWLREEAGASELAHQNRSRTIEAALTIAAGSSTRAQAIAESTVRRLLQRVRFVRLSRVQLSVRVLPRERAVSAAQPDEAPSADSTVPSLVSDS